jgi:MoxR-like ATPase
MAAEHPPFELISRPDPELHRAADKQKLLAQRQPPGFLSSHQRAALHYQPSDALLLAINMALHTGSPLLLTGEPGTGKTQAADFVGAYFGIPVYKFLVKSTSIAQDLLYEFDAVGYLHWAQATSQRPPVGNTSQPDDLQPSPEAIAAETEAVRHGFLHKRALWQAYEESGDAVVLIDEIDKAPRDFPNDLLHELDQHSFPHPFNHTQLIRPCSSRPPIVIATSNEERRLPDAFLRRCIFHRIELTPELVAAAVESMARAVPGDSDSMGVGGGFPNLGPEARAMARQRFWDIRQLQEIEKKPSTAELLTWLCILSARRVDASTLERSRLRDLPGIEALIKDYGDLQRLG